MAKFIGAVRFPDGELLSFIHNAGMDTALPRLFKDQFQASDSWDENQSELISSRKIGSDDEIVDVFSIYDEDGENSINYRSTANRKTMMITGPLDEESAVREKLWNYGDDELKQENKVSQRKMRP